MTQPAPQPSGAPGPSGPRAGFGIRLGAFLLDGLIVGIPLNLALFAIDVFVVRQSLGLIVAIAYSVFFIGSGSGQTIGMKICNIRAIDAETGGRVDYGKAVVRYLVGLASGLACLIGYFWMLWDPEKQTWHDKVAGTYVVPTSAYPVAEWPG
ncbi:MAG: RDD family protein [Acidimicrobiia bacterium]